MSHIIAISDIVGQHKAVHEAHVAAEAIAGELQGHKEQAAAAFNCTRDSICGIYADPEVEWGASRRLGQGTRLHGPKGSAPLGSPGCAIANDRDEGFTKLLFDDSPEVRGHGRILGGGMVGTHAW